MISFHGPDQARDPGETVQLPGSVTTQMTVTEMQRGMSIRHPCPHRSRQDSGEVGLAPAPSPHASPRTDCLSRHHLSSGWMLLPLGTKVPAFVDVRGLYFPGTVGILGSGLQGLPILRASSSAPRNLLKPSGQSPGRFSQLLGL